jgi:hypothetical protein
VFKYYPEVKPQHDDVKTGERAPTPSKAGVLFTTSLVSALIVLDANIVAVFFAIF